jgi:hypothetical protein
MKYDLHNCLVWGAVAFIAVIGWATIITIWDRIF